MVRYWPWGQAGRGVRPTHNPRWHGRRVPFGAGGGGEPGIEARHGGRGEHQRQRRNSSGKVSGDETHRGGSTPMRWWRGVPTTMGSDDGWRRRWAGPTAPWGQGGGEERRKSKGEMAGRGTHRGRVWVAAAGPNSLMAAVDGMRARHASVTVWAWPVGQLLWARPDEHCKILFKLFFSNWLKFATVETMPCRTKKPYKIWPWRFWSKE
jgi:hypothetical protein